MATPTPAAHPRAAPRAGALHGLAALLLVVALALFIGPARATVAEPRHALVVGNAAYAQAPLSNPANDARAVAAALRKAGFTVDLRLDATQRQLNEAIRAFGDRLKGGGAGLFYFAGHGVQIKGRNFLLPVGEDIRREDEVPFRAVDVQMVLDKMESAKNRVNVVILDACRDNPFARASRSAGGGLGSMDAPIGSLVAFATAPGSVASDGQGAHGLYTQHLLANIEKPGLPIEEVFKRVRLGVRLDSNGRQVPWENTSLEGDFFFVPPAAAARPATATLPPPPALEHIARAERAHELLRQRQLDDAERLFQALARDTHPEVALMGQEGLAEALLARGDTAGALQAANDIIARAPTRGAAYLTRGRALAARGDAAAAPAALRQAADDGTVADFSFQKSQALVALGNAQRARDPQAAQAAYERAARLDRQSVQALSNLAVALQQGGQWQRAQALLERANALDPRDAITIALLRQLKESVAEGQDRARQASIDASVRELVARLRNPPPRPAAAGTPDDWTSPVMALSVLPFQDQALPGAAGRIGLEVLVQQELIRELQARGHTLVERRLLDQVLAEARLGASELADPDTQVRLGRLLAARLIVSGVMTHEPGGLAASVRAIDTETTQLAMVRAERQAGGGNPAALAAAIAQQIAATLQEKYPLRGRIALVEDDRVVINLGQRHGVRAGQAFHVVERGAPIELGGRVLGHRDTRVARLTVTEVQEQLAYARVAERQGPLSRNQRVVVARPE
jgi:uncharacterized caspase-like protein